MPSRLFVSDLDGTLLQRNGRLSDYAVAGLEALTKKGIPFTVASGRSFASIRHALEPLQLQLPIISSDGALISSFDDPAPLHLFSMDVDPLDELVAFLRNEGFHPVLDQWTGTANVSVGAPPQNPVEHWYHDFKCLEPYYQWDHAPNGQ